MSKGLGLKIVWLLLAGCGTALASAAAQEAPDSKTAPADVVADSDSSKEAKDKNKTDAPRDPTRNEKLKRLLTKEEKTVAAVAAPRIPDMVLRAILKASDKSASALVEVDKRLYTVKEGTEFSVRSSTGRELKLKVLQVNKDGVEIEVVELKEKVSLR